MLYPYGFSRELNTYPERITPIKYFMQVGPVGLLKWDHKGVCAFMTIDFNRAASQGTVNEWVFHIGSFFSQIAGYGIPGLKTTPGFMRRQRECYNNPEKIIRDPLFLQSVLSQSGSVRSDVIQNWWGISGVPYGYLKTYYGYDVTYVAASSDFIDCFKYISEMFFNSHRAPVPHKRRIRNSPPTPLPPPSVFPISAPIQFTNMFEGEVVCYAITFRLKPKYDLQDSGFLHEIAVSLHREDDNSYIYIMDPNIGLFKINDIVGAEIFINALVNMFYGGKIFCQVYITEQPLFWFPIDVIQDPRLQIENRQRYSTQYRELERNLYTREGYGPEPNVGSRVFSYIFSGQEPPKSPIRAPDVPPLETSRANSVVSIIPEENATMHSGASVLHEESSSIHDDDSIIPPPAGSTIIRQRPLLPPRRSRLPARGSIIPAREESADLSTDQLRTLRNQCDTYTNTVVDITIDRVPGRGLFS